jgi:hypothetical protein
MFREVVEDVWEEWDVWCWHKLTGRVQSEDIAAAEELARFRERLLPLLDQPRTHMTDEEQRAWVRYEQAVAAIAPRVSEASRAGRLLWPLRQILPFWSIFHWNRMAFDTGQQHLLAMLMIAVLSPKW